MSRAKAKRHQALQDLSKELRGFRISETFSIFGHTYKLGVLAPGDEDWVHEQAGRSNNVVEYAALMQKPRLAAALLEIDGIPVTQLFSLPDDLDKGVREAIEADQKQLTAWRRGEVLDFMRDDMDLAVISQLDSSLTQLEARKQEAISQVVPFSKETPSTV